MPVEDQSATADSWLNERLLGYAKGVDQSCVGELSNRYRPEIIAVLRRVVDFHTAEDIAAAISKSSSGSSYL